MKKEVLEEVEKNLAEINAAIAELQNEFAEKFRGEYTEETIRIEAKKIALQKLQEQLIAMKKPISIMCNGGVMANAEKQAKTAVQATQGQKQLNRLVGSAGIKLTRYA